jgi:hypothetical protein
MCFMVFGLEARVAEKLRLADGAVMVAAVGAERHAVLVDDDFELLDRQLFDDRPAAVVFGR